MADGSEGNWGWNVDRQEPMRMDAISGRAVDVLAGWERDVIDRGVSEDGVSLTERVVTTKTQKTVAQVIHVGEELRLYVGPAPDTKDVVAWAAMGSSIPLTADQADSLAARLSDCALKLRAKGR